MPSQPTTLKVEGDLEVKGTIKGKTLLPLITVDNTDVPQTVRLPEDPQEGDHFIIKDTKGMASTNPITLQGSHAIDGNDRFILDNDRAAIHVVFSGKFSDPDQPGEWYVV